MCQLAFKARPLPLDSQKQPRNTKANFNLTGIAKINLLTKKEGKKIKTNILLISLLYSYIKY